MQSSHTHPSQPTALAAKERAFVLSASEMITNAIMEYKSVSPNNVLLNAIIKSSKDDIKAILNTPPPESIPTLTPTKRALLHARNCKSFFEDNPRITEDNIWRYRYALLTAYLTNLINKSKNWWNGVTFSQMLQERLQQIRKNRADALPDEVQEVEEISYADFINQLSEREYKAYIAGIRQLKADNELNQHVQKLADLAEGYCANRDLSRYQECVTILRPALTLINPGATRSDKEKASQVFLVETQYAEQRQTAFKKNFLAGMILVSSILLAGGAITCLFTLPPPLSLGVATGMIALALVLRHLAEKMVSFDSFFHSHHNPGFFTKPTLKEVKAISKHSALTSKAHVKAETTTAVDEHQARVTRNLMTA